ncbi:prephenate dehydratase [Geomicrobium sp. JCM 19038]|uniref:prephenate dehydratase n=1 Tax=Geomicrobium sp. JCM 19038 TaxID=1460635 RepID=UPI0005A8A908|nr:prephenate dehydratase [Geomicrobium sp. JCM 19038]
MTNKVAFLGPAGTFTEIAARAFLPDAKRMPYKDIPSTLHALEKNQVDAAVVPLENTIEGSVNISLDYLIHKHDFPIIGEVAIPIAQHLLVHPAVNDLHDIDTVYSHPHAIAQCHEFITGELDEVEQKFATSTAQAAREVSENEHTNIAAIANELAAEKYGLKVIQENIHDFTNNHTRFVLVSPNDVAPSFLKANEQHSKTKVVVTLPSDFSGALHQVLSAFAWRKLNLTKIESRPTKTGLGNYFFIIDVEHAYDEVLLPGALEELKALGCETRVLGTYPSLFVQVKERSL